jgi:hypothetical protein
MTSRPATTVPPKSTAIRGERPTTGCIADPAVVRRSFCALDEASYHLDSASAPWSVHLEVRVTDSVVEDRLRQAMGVALARHPRARAWLTTDRWDRVEWGITPGPDVDPLGLDTAQTAALIAKAAAGTTVNDLPLAGLHLALESWNCGHGGAAGRLSVLMPVNLRPKASWREVFGNFTFMVPVVTRPADRAEPTATVEAIRRRTRRIKHQCTPAAAVSLFDVLQHLPLPAKQSIAHLAASQRVIPTAILSNLGCLDEDLDFGPELRASYLAALVHLAACTRVGSPR